jgi:hypothetical protein
MAKLADLMKVGLLQAGETLIWEQKHLGKIHRAEVTPQGFIKTQDGAIHKTPSGAAKHLNNQKPIDGWLAWKTEKKNEKLGQLRSQISTTK